MSASAPAGNDVAVKYQKEKHGVQRIEFTPKEVGKLSKVFVCVFLLLLFCFCLILLTAYVV